MKTQQVPRTAKPCPGCGEGYPFPFRDADKVCQKCQDTLAWARRKKEEDLKSDQLMLVPGVSHGYAYMPHQDFHSGLDEAFHKVVLLSTKEGPFEWHEVPDGTFDFRVIGELTTYNRSHHTPVVRLAPLELQQALAGLRLIIGASLEHAYKEGVKVGNNLLAKLARGEMTGKEYNDATLKEEE